MQIFHVWLTTSKVFLNFLLRSKGVSVPRGTKKALSCWTQFLPSCFSLWQISWMSPKQFVSGDFRREITLYHMHKRQENTGILYCMRAGLLCCTDEPLSVRLSLSKWVWVYACASFFAWAGLVVLFRHLGFETLMSSLTSEVIGVIGDHHFYM